MCVCVCVWVTDFCQLITYMCVGDSREDLNLNSASLIVTVEVLAITGACVCDCVN